MSRVTHFEIQASDPQALIAFYSSAGIKDRDGNILGLMQPDPGPSL